MIKTATIKVGKTIAFRDSIDYCFNACTIDNCFGARQLSWQDCQTIIFRSKTAPIITVRSSVVVSE